MKKFLPLLLLLVFLGSCKKYIQKKQEEMVTEAVTTGRWKVTSYMEGSDDLTAHFSGYQFQFNTTETVDAYLNNTKIATGIWQVDKVNYIITAGFNNATDPLVLLNGKWQMVNSTWTSAEASQPYNGQIRKLRLDKLP